MLASRTTAPLTASEAERISFLRLFLVVLLVMLHFGNLYGTGINVRDGYYGQDYGVASIVVSFVLFAGYTAVPALSVISGFLFFRGADRRTPPRFLPKWRSRLKSLVLPFLIWGGVYALLALILSRSGTGFLEYAFPPETSLWFGFLNAWLGITEIPFAIQLWFVRDLILTIALSPVIWLAMGWAPRSTIAALFILWLGDHNLWIFTRLDVVGFFSLGAGFAMHGWRRDIADRYALPLLAVFLVMVLVRTILPYFTGTSDGWGLYVMTCLMRVLGVVSAWSAAPILLNRTTRALTDRYSYIAFFTHCAHYPPILAVKGLFATLIVPTGSAGHLAVYGLTVATTLIGIGFVAHFMRQITPRLFSILSGGRTGPETKSRVPETVWT